MALRSWKFMNVGVLAPTFTHPQDYGNRKRLFAVCDALTRAGANIHLLHYASELNWRASVDTDALRDASQRWTSVFTIPPARSPHAAPGGTHHEIDEWWDPIIGEHVAWAARTCSFDVLIVMYPYLSKAFEFVSERVYKILDMNDRFSGRKELFEANGLKPEFFYLTKEEEAKALHRADLVWAIKEEEAAFFRSLGAPNVLALPHVDALSPVERKGGSGDVLRAGFIGAPNPINLRNITNFLRQAVPVFREYLPPLEIVVGGNAGALLKQTNTPYLSAMGPMKSVESFYEQIDVAIVPMTFSTGLKIKTTEALSFGVPVVAHAHAFEGLPAGNHPYHRLQSHEEIAEALVELAFSPEKLEPLRDASRKAAVQLVEATEAALDRSRAVVEAARKATLYVGSIADIETDSFAFDCLTSRLNFLSNRAPLLVCLEGEADGLAVMQLTRRIPAARFILDGASNDSYRPGNTNVFPTGSAGEILESITSIREVVFERLPNDSEQAGRRAKFVVLADLLPAGRTVAQWEAPANAVIASTLSPEIGGDPTRAPVASKTCPPFWFRNFIPLRELEGRTVPSNGIFCLIADAFDERIETLCKTLASVHGFKSIRVFGFSVRPPIPLLGGARIHFADLRQAGVLLETAAAARAVAAIRSGPNTLLDGFAFALELLGRNVTQLRFSEQSSWLPMLEACRDVTGRPDSFSLRTISEMGSKPGWRQLLPPHDAVEIGGSGLSEVLYNKARCELFLRGYAFDADGGVEPIAVTQFGHSFEATRWKIFRRELKAVPDQRCGWEFLLPNIKPEDLRTRIDIKPRYGSGPHPAIRIVPKAKAKPVSIDIALDAVKAEAGRLLLRGTIFGNRDALARAVVSIDKLLLPEAVLSIDRSHSDPARTPFAVEAPLGTEAAPAGKTVELAIFLQASASYAINTAKVLSESDLAGAPSPIDVS
jgi:glycosyltransferase involved in cell wall biosynthesis